MGNTFKNSTKVWLTSVVASPVLFCGLHVSREDVLINPGTVFRLIGAGWVIGGLFSIPHWLLMHLIVRWISSMRKPMWVKKALIQLFALVIIQGVFILLDPDNKTGWNTFWTRRVDDLPFY